MKKFLAILLTALLIFCLFGCKKEEENNTDNTNSGNSAAEDATYGDFHYTVNEKGDYEITGYSYAGKDLVPVVIPSEIEGRPVTGIGQAAFKAAKNIQSVTIPDSVTYIGDFAFFDCDYITEIKIPAAVTTIGMGAFMKCDRLATVTLADGVKELGNYAFKDCTALNQLTLSKDLVVIGEAAFMGCTALTAVTIPDSVKQIGDVAFYGCDHLADVTYLADATNEDKAIITKMNAALAASETEEPTFAEAISILAKAGLYAGGVTENGFLYVWDKESNTVIASVGEADTALLTTINQTLANAETKPSTLNEVLTVLSNANVKIDALNQSAAVCPYLWDADAHQVVSVKMGQLLFNDCGTAEGVSLRFTVTANSAFDQYLTANNYKSSSASNA